MDIGPRDLLRHKGTPFAELGLDDPSLTDDQLIDAMMDHPSLINRPIVVTGKGAALCRPSEKALDLLDQPVAIFTKKMARPSTSRLNKMADSRLDDLPNVIGSELRPIDTAGLANAGGPIHPPRILVHYGSLRERSFSRLLSEEAARLLQWFGCEVRTFDPSGLPLPDDAAATHPKVHELRDLANWSEGMVWVSLERHGAMTGIMKSQIDWIPLSEGATRPTQGKTLAIM